MSEKNMFFILGSVRSGTTLLRDLLKAHPKLNCPEETHIFRWAEAFASNDYMHVNKVADTLIKHRQMDGVNEADFQRILEQSTDRKDFMLNYLHLFEQASATKGLRFFDKTPQNVYGLSLIRGYFPNAKIVHIVRNPLNVVSSLKQGKVLLPQTLTSAINFWKESVMIINTLKPLLGGDLFELSYETLTHQPQRQMNALFEFLDEPTVNYSTSINKVYQARDNYHNLLSQTEIATVCQQLQPWMDHYGYVM